LSEIQEVSSSGAPRCGECGAEQEQGGECAFCASCGAEFGERETFDGTTEPTVNEPSSDHPRYAAVREQVASILRDLRPGDVDHASEIAESIRTRKTLTPTSMFVLLLMSLLVGWFAARWGTELVFQRRVARDADRLSQRIESYRTETGLYPDAALWRQWVSGGDAAAFLDPWQRPYLYSVDSRSYSIATNGADGAPGGHWRSRDVTIVFPYVNSRMALPHAQPKTSPASR